MDEIPELAKDPTFLKAVAIELSKRPELLEIIAKAALGRVATKDDIIVLKDDIRMLIDMIRSTASDFKSYVDSRISDLKSYIDARIESLDKRISLLQRVILICFSLISLLIALAAILS